MYVVSLCFKVFQRGMYVFMYNRAQSGHFPTAEHTYTLTHAVNDFFSGEHTTWRAKIFRLYVRIRFSSMSVRIGY